LHVAHKIDLDLQRKIGKIFRSKVDLCTTKCIREELKKLGMTCSGAFNHSLKMKALRCAHDFACEPGLCIRSHVGKGNSSKFLVATQDGELQNDLNTIGRVPVLRFVNSNVLDLMKTSEEFDKLISKKDKKKYLPTQEEMKAVRQVQKEEDEERRKERILQIRRNAELLGVQLKKRAKGPNPLAVQKKIVKKA